MMLAVLWIEAFAQCVVPDGVTLPPSVGEDAGKVQTIGARYVHGEISLEQASLEAVGLADPPGGGCQFANSRHQ
ncbi:MAG: hypothetical protein R3C05_13100 [Pirellulaceae bacterium]